MSIWLVNPLFSVAFFPKSVENVRFRHVLMQKTTFQPVNGWPHVIATNELLVYPNVDPGIDWSTLLGRCLKELTANKG